MADRSKTKTAATAITSQVQPAAKARHVTVLDGGFSTQLERHVGEHVDGHPLWCARFLATKPLQVLHTHLDYLRAGAEIIITNTYQASIGGFREHLNLDRDASIKLMMLAVELAKKAVSMFMEENPGAVRPLVAGSIGPYGAALHDGSEYTGDYAESVTATELARWHRPRILALLAAGVDILAFETIPARIEAQVLVDMLSEFPDTRAWLSFSCRSGEGVLRYQLIVEQLRRSNCGKHGFPPGKDEKCTARGEPFGETARSCWQRNPHQLVAVGVNCLSPKFVAPLLRRVNVPGTPVDQRIPLVAYPNSGEVYHPKTGWNDSDHAAPVDSYVEEWLSLGVDLVGGCCRTTADDTKSMRARVDAWNERAASSATVDNKSDENAVPTSISSGHLSHELSRVALS